MSAPVRTLNLQREKVHCGCYYFWAAHAQTLNQFLPPFYFSPSLLIEVSEHIV